ncbi:hypothetical protein [Hymenobacter baengnokdamensis]|uniref:hypothetical protein n=1 Tax=Hymenobacter baengnokdamensis TaxID=2615203 RepID=UPI001248AC34|nr:hypothetical protein [Hymenobacter baengnokdamensis]
MLTKSIGYELLPYTEGNLAYALSNDYVLPSEVRKKHHFCYFCEYFGSTNDGLAARTILIEHPYVSSSFQADYADYYSRGFADYPRYCKRVHFFSQGFDQPALEAALTDLSQAALWHSYLGYIVIKPLPATPIGATLLKPYGNGLAKFRNYPVQRLYKLNLLGKQLSVETLAFQEQDVNVSACATTALWMAFHKTASLFQTPLPSPYQITASTGNLFNSTGRVFPNKGLDLYQVGKAIESVGLVSELRLYQPPSELHARALKQIQSLPAEQQPDPSRWPELCRQAAESQMQEAKGLIHAYLRMGLPILLFIQLENLGGHLVTITGYREAEAVPLRSINISLLSDRIERLYVHDDQIGPFARVGFTHDGRLETAWPTGSDWQNCKKAVLDAVSVPIIPDIRIEYEQVYEKVALFDQALHDFIPEGEDLLWDIHLSYSNTYKEELRKQRHSNYSHLNRLLKTLLPKYIWVARASLGDSILLEMVFDATDLHTGFYCQLINVFGPLRGFLHNLLEDPTRQADFEAAPSFDPRYLPLLLRDLDLMH